MNSHTCLVTAVVLLSIAISQPQKDLLQLMMTAHTDDELGHAEDIPLTVEDYKKRGMCCRKL